MENRREKIGLIAVEFWKDKIRKNGQRCFFHPTAGGAEKALK
jgi:hypothetical protein